MRIEQFAAQQLPLANAGELSVFFIGAGSAFTKVMNQNNILVVKGEQHLLVDCGNKCTQALHELGLHAPDLHNLLVTHTHADHIGGLEEIMLMNRYMAGKKPNIVINERFQTILWEHSLRGGAAYSEVRDGQPLGFEDFWNPLRPHPVPDMPRETWGYRLGDLDLKMPRTMHFPNNAASWRDSFWSSAVIFDDRVLFTSDTRFDPGLTQTYDEIFDFELIFHDCQLFTGGVHASLEELTTLPERLRSKIVLMHYGDNWRNFERQALDAGFHSFARQGCCYRFPAP